MRGAIEQIHITEAHEKRFYKNLLAPQPIAHVVRDSQSDEHLVGPRSVRTRGTRHPQCELRLGAPLDAGEVRVPLAVQPHDAGVPERATLRHIPKTAVPPRPVHSTALCIYR